MARGHALALLAVACHGGEPFDIGVAENNPGQIRSEDSEEPKPNRPVPDTGVDADATSLNSVPEALATAPIDASSADANGAHSFALGSACWEHADCESRSCSSGLCCDRICGPCEACSGSGACVPLGVCGSEICDASTCACDAGSCPAQRASLGAPCHSASECASDFCIIGTCCDAACDGPCQDCGSNGICDQVPATDPLCEPVTCAPDACHVARPPIEHACINFGQCAGPESCNFYNALPATPCGEEGARCNTEGKCTTDYRIPPVGPTQLCPPSGGALVEARANLGASIICWTGSSYELGLTLAIGGMTMGNAGENSRVLTSYLLQIARSAKTQAYTSDDVLIPGCVVVDTAEDGVSVVATFDDDTCRHAAFVRVTAHESLGADL